MREAARQISSYLAAAQTRAIAQGREVGVMFLRSPTNTGACFQLAMCKSPPPYAGEFPTARVVSVGTSTVSVRFFDPNAPANMDPTTIRPLNNVDGDDSDDFVRVETRLFSTIGNRRTKSLASLDLGERF